MRALRATAALCLSWICAGAQAHDLPSLSHRDRLFDVARHGDTALVVGHPGLVLRADARGARFTRVAVPSQEALFGVAFDPAGERVAIVGRACSLLWSEDGGRTFRDLSASLREPCAGAALLDVALLADGSLVVVGELGTILVSRDGAKTFTRVGYDSSLPAAPEASAAPAPGEPSAEDENEGAIEEARLSSVTFAGADVGYVAGEFGLLLATNDGGRSWRRQRSGTDKLLFSIATRDRAHALAVGAEGTVIETRDAGTTWSAVAAPTRAGLFGLALHGERVLISGEAGTLLARSSSVQPLQTRDSRVHTWLEAAVLFDERRALVVGGRGHVLIGDGTAFERRLGE